MQVARTSVEGRPIHDLHIGHTNPNALRRLFITELLHAREWVATVMATYFAERLVLVNDHILVGVEELLVPIQNPEWYEHTRTGILLWRQPRLVVRFSKQNCTGVDLNRNWNMDFQGRFSTS